MYLKPEFCWLVVAHAKVIRFIGTRWRTCTKNGGYFEARTWQIRVHHLGVKKTSADEES